MKGDMKTKLQYSGRKTGDTSSSLETMNVRDRSNMLTDFRYGDACFRYGKIFKLNLKHDCDRFTDCGLNKIKGTLHF